MPDTQPAGEGANAAPQKYIRTFDSDQKTLKEGGKPELTPLARTSAPAPAAPAKEVILPNVPEQAMPAPEPAKSEFVVPTASSAAPLPDEYIRTFDADKVVAGKGAHPDLTPLRKEAPPQEFMPRPQMPVAAELQTSPLHTYSGDFSDLVKREGASRATILAAEEDVQRAPSAPAPSARSAGSLWYALGGILLLALGGAGAYYAYSVYSTSKQPVALLPTVSAPIFVDARQEISGSATALMQAIEQSATAPLAANQVRLLYTAVSTTTGDSVFSALQLPAPGALLRNVNANGSMAGIISSGSSQAPFFILSVASYPETFAAMLSWEPTMPASLALLFPDYAVSTQARATSTATSTPVAAASAPSGLGGWRDVVVSNHDARAYQDAAGRTVLIYGYWDAQTLIIARDEPAFSALLSRLATSRTTQ